MELIDTTTHDLQLLHDYSAFLVHVVRVKNHADMRAHDHVFHEIVYVESGTAEHLTTAGVRKLHPGDIIVLRPRMWHGYRHTQSFTIINCLFANRLLCQYGTLLSLVQGTFDLFRRRHQRPAEAAPQILHARPFQQTQILIGLEAMMLELREKPADWQAALMVRLLDFLVTIARLDQVPGKSGVPPMESRAKEAVLEVVDCLEAQFAESINLTDLAQRVHLSPPYLSRSFKRQMGMSIFRYLNHLRIEEACRRLRFSKESISEVSSRVGYDDFAYFSRCFRRELGSSPREYRYQYKSK